MVRTKSIGTALHTRLWWYGLGGRKYLLWLGTLMGEERNFKWDKETVVWEKRPNVLLREEAWIGKYRIGEWDEGEDLSTEINHY